MRSKQAKDTYTVARTHQYQENLSFTNIYLPEVKLNFNKRNTIPSKNTLWKNTLCKTVNSNNATILRSI